MVVGRDWKRLLRTPESLFFAAVMPVLFVLGLAAVFGPLVETVLGQDYIQFLLPGVLVMQVTLAAGATGVGLATDLRDGIIDRFRSLPMAQIAVLTGRTTADLARNTLAADRLDRGRLRRSDSDSTAAWPAASPHSASPCSSGTRPPGCSPLPDSPSKTPKRPTSSGSPRSCSSSTSPARGFPSKR